MHHDSKLTTSREPGLVEALDPERNASRGVIRPRAHRGASTFAGWGPKLA